MLQVMYIFIAALSLYLECSREVNTTNIFKKAALLSIVIGSILSLSGTDNNLIEIGAVLYIFIRELPIMLRFTRKNKILKRRSTDEVST